MKFGLLMPFWNPARWQRPFPALYEELLRQIVHIEDLGYDNIWLTEHHFDDDGWSPALLPLAAGIATRTKRIRIGTFILILPFQNAVRVAEDAVTVDLLSNGRFDLGVGKGYRNKEFDGFGFPREEREERLEEDLQVIQGVWTDDSYSFDGKYYNLRGIHLTPAPVQKPHPPIWIGARGKKAVERAARMGFHLMGTGEVSQQQQYDRELERCGRSPEQFHLAQLRWVYVADTRDKAWEIVGEHMHYLFASAFPLLKKAGDLRSDRGMSQVPSIEELRSIDPTIPGGTPIVGTPQDCIDAIQRYRDETRVTHLAMGMHLPGLALDKVTACLEMFATEVMPHFQTR